MNNRDERQDGGAPIFAQCITRTREVQPGCSIEVLIPDFKGEAAPLETVMGAEPAVLNHNTETVPRLYRKVRGPKSDYRWTLELLRRSAWNLAASPWTTCVGRKSGILLCGFERSFSLSLSPQVGEFNLCFDEHRACSYGAIECPGE